MDLTSNKWVQEQSRFMFLGFQDLHKLKSSTLFTLKHGFHFWFCFQGYDILITKFQEQRVQYDATFGALAFCVVSIAASTVRQVEDVEWTIGL